jgi:hypothetical protein
MRTFLWERRIGRTAGQIDKKTGKLKGLIISITPLGSFLITGRIAANLMLNGGFSGLAHFSTFVYKVVISAMVGSNSRLRS